MNKKLIFPSLMAADQLNLQQEIDQLTQYVDGFHLDVMDDHLVPNLALSIDTVNQIAQATHKPLSVHLMVDHVESIITQLKVPAGSIISFHAFTPDGVSLIADLPILLEHVKRQNWQTSIALSPGQLVDTIKPVFELLDNVLVMSVMPGFSGQQFMPESLNTIDELAVRRKDYALTFTIAVDGGIDEHNIAQIARLGADILCVGSGIFRGNDRIGAIERLRTACMENV